MIDFMTFCALLVCSLMLPLGCTPGDESPVSTQKPNASRPSIEEVIDQYAETLLAIPGVVGLGEGRCDGEPCIVIFVVEKTEELVQQLPEELEGYPVQIKETGEFRTRPG